MSWKSDLENLFDKTEGEVFEKTTFDSLGKLMNNGYIDSFEFPISTGKEGNVFRGLCKNEMIAVKIYRINTATFRSISKYLLYEPPRNINRSRRGLIFSWALKELNNLKKLYTSGVRVPKPIACEGNVIVMEYIGSKEQPAPILKNSPLKNVGDIFEKIKEYLRIMFCNANLVHSDFSEYNILLYKDEPVIIDVGQTVSADNPMAKTFLERDVGNIVKFFKKFINVDEHEIIRYIMRC